MLFYIIGKVWRTKCELFIITAIYFNTEIHFFKMMGRIIASVVTDFIFATVIGYLPMYFLLPRKFECNFVLYLLCIYDVFIIVDFIIYIYDVFICFYIHCTLSGSDKINKINQCNFTAGLL